ncbi:MAG: hypothetical protein ACRDLB_12060 [Actinomycetota bacterium]
MAGRTNGFLTELEASFDAAVARDENIAADDLARSFRQDERLTEILSRGGARFVDLGHGARLPVVEVGADYALAGTTAPILVHVATAIFHPATDGGPPRTSSATWLEVLRTWAIERRKVQVTALGRTMTGILAEAARDHLTVDTDGGPALIPHAVVAAVRSCPGD